MKKRWIASLALSLGLMTTATRAADDPWRMPPKPPAPAAQIGRPVAESSTPANLPPLVDSQVKPTGFSGSPVLTEPLMRTQGGDPGVARPLPVGTPSPSGNMHTWKKGDELGAPSPLISAGPPQNGLGKPVSSEPETLHAPRVESSGQGGPLWSRFTHPLEDCGCTDGSCGSCGVQGMGCCDDGCYNPGNRWYVSAEYLAWWMKGNPVPPLVTSGTITDANPGALGQPGTRVLFGGDELGTGPNSGVRVMAGLWFTRDRCLGIEAGFWFLGNNSDNFSASSLGMPALFRPLVNAGNGQETVQIVAVPGPNNAPGLAGTVNVNSSTSLWGTEANFRRNLWCGENWFCDGLLGFRGMGLDDDLTISENLTFLRDATTPQGTFASGTNIVIMDHFRTTNRFYGGQIGFDSEYRSGNWIFGLKTKLGLGATQQIVDIDGGNVITRPGQGPQALPPVVLAQGSNIGRFSRTEFTFVPEVGVSIGYQFNEHWRVFAGYNVIYWSSVARAGAQVDRVANVGQGGADRPTVLFGTTDFWAQGINVGLEFKW